MEKNINDLYKLLMRVGFLAADCASTPVAEKLFQAVLLAKPSSEAPLIGLAYNAILAGRFDEAIQLLKEKALKLNPESSSAKVYLGLALGCKGEKEASNTILAEVASQSEDTSTANFAKLIPQFLGTAAAA